MRGRRGLLCCELRSSERNGTDVFLLLLLPDGWMDGWMDFSFIFRLVAVGWLGRQIRMMNLRGFRIQYVWVRDQSSLDLAVLDFHHRSNAALCAKVRLVDRLIAEECSVTRSKCHKNSSGFN